LDLFLVKVRVGLGTNLFINAPQPGGIFSIFDSSCHLLVLRYCQS